MCEAELGVLPIDRGHPGGGEQADRCDPLVQEDQPPGEVPRVRHRGEQEDLFAAGECVIDENRQEKEDDFRVLQLDHGRRRSSTNFFRCLNHQRCDE